MKKKETNKSTFPKYYYLTKTFDGDDRHYTVCAKVERVNDKTLMRKDGDDIKAIDGHYMKLTVGWSICCGEDKFVAEVGEEIAKNRTKNRKIGGMYSPYNGEFNVDVVNAIMEAKCKYLHDNISHFLPKENTYEISVDLGVEDNNKADEIVIDTEKNEDIGKIITALIGNAEKEIDGSVLRSEVPVTEEKGKETMSENLIELKKILSRI